MPLCLLDGVPGLRSVRPAQRKPRLLRHRPRLLRRRPQANIAQQSFLNERYQRGAEMLGSDVLAVRLGGIYALRHLAEEYPEQYHVQVMLLFCAFVRNPVEHNGITKLDWIDTEPPHGVPPPLREDVQAIMDAIGARRKEYLTIESKARFRLNLRGSDLRGVRLIGANLSCAPWEDLTGLTTAEQFTLPLHTDLSNAQLCSAQLGLAEMQKADLTSACLCDAWLTPNPPREWVGSAS